jgi:dolichyl-phosphate-mannose-protein mannosyltransferase
LVSNLDIQDDSIAESFAENGLLTQARLILLDSPLMIMTAFTGLAFTSFTNQHEQGPTKAFQPTWWFWLAMTGLGLGATVSVKWVGLFTIAWVGSLTILQLWILLGDVKTVTPVCYPLFLTIIPLIIPASFRQAFSSQNILSYCHPGLFLHGNVRHPFHLLGEPW